MSSIKIVAPLCLLAALACGGPALALECPTPQKLAQPGVLKETQAQIDQTAKMLSSGDQLGQIQAVINDLRTRYPHVENAEIVNYLISAYCPVAANAPGLPEWERKARLDNFVNQVMSLLY